jgi:hypothetical protein
LVLSIAKKHGAACTARKQPARAQRIASQPLRIASARASHPVHRSALHRNQLATHRPAHRILYSAAHRANATSPRIANNPRTDNQPATHSPPRHTSHLQLCTRFAVLCAGFVWFVVLTFPKFNLYTLQIAILSCVRSSVGTGLGNLTLCPGFESGRKCSDFFYFRHFLHS